MTLSQRQIMNRVYKDICGFEIPQHDVAKVRSSKGSPVYGEITITSTDKLFSHLDVSSKDVLYDLGSGVGKLVLFAGLFTPIKKSVGVELSKIRHDDSLRALERASTFTKKLEQRCQFANADFLSMDLKNASIIYTCSTAFSMDFMRKLTNHLASFSHPYRLVTLQPLQSERHFTLVDDLRLDMSWQRATPVYVYQRRAD